MGMNNFVVNCTCTPWTLCWPPQSDHLYLHLGEHSKSVDQTDDSAEEIPRPAQIP